MLSRFLVVLWLGWALSAEAAGRPRAVATTTLVGDVLRRLAGDHLEVRVLLPPGCDPHAFQPTPRDAATLADADIVFANGVGLEDTYLPGLLRQSRAHARLVEVSDGIALRTLEESDEHTHGGADPHVWFDPLNVKIWARNMESALRELDPVHATDFAAASAQLQSDLDALDQWVQERFGKIPAERRQLVTDHDSMGYFAGRYGFRLVGAVIPGFSTGAEPSAREMAALESVIRRERAPAIFVGRGQPAALAGRISADTGARLVELDTCALREGQDYLGFMRENVNAIVEALK